MQAKSVTIAIKNVALPQGKSKKTTKSAPAPTGSDSDRSPAGVTRNRDGHGQRRQYAYRDDQ